MTSMKCKLGTILFPDLLQSCNPHANKVVVCMCMYLEHFVFRVHSCRDDGRSENLYETRGKRKAFGGIVFFLLILQKWGEGDPFAPVPTAQMYVYLTGRSEVVH